MPFRRALPLALAAGLLAGCGAPLPVDGEEAAGSIEHALEAVLAPGLGRSYPGMNVCFGDRPQNEFPSSVAFAQGRRQDGSAVPRHRSDASLAAGGPDGSSVALGFGGSLIVRFPLLVRDGAGPDLRIRESSPGVTRCADGPERARIEVSYDGIGFHPLPGEACAGEANRFDLADLPADADFRLRYFGVRYARVIDVTAPADFAHDPAADGFDLDSVEGLNCGGQARAVDLCAHGATEVIRVAQGIGVAGAPVPPDRSDLLQALDTPEDADSPVPVSWYTLGRGGEILLGFGGPVRNRPGPDLAIGEATFSRTDASCGSYPERARVEAYGTRVGGGEGWVELGTICQDAAFDIGEAGLLQIDVLRLVDVTDFVTSDGFDLDGVGCAAP